MSLNPFEKWITFDRPGVVHSLIPINFGKHYWTVTILNSLNINLNNEEFSGLMKVGVTTNKAGPQKVHGPVINYSTNKGVIKVKLMIDFERKFLRAFTSSNLKGDVYHDL